MRRVMYLLVNLFGTLLQYLCLWIQTRQFSILFMDNLSEIIIKNGSDPWRHLVIYRNRTRTFMMRATLNTAIDIAVFHCRKSVSSAFLQQVKVFGLRCQLLYHLNTNQTLITYLNNIRRMISLSCQYNCVSHNSKELS